MRLYSFEIAGDRRIGAEQAGRLVDLAAARAALGGDAAGYTMPGDLMSFIRGGEAALSTARDILARTGEQASADPPYMYPFDRVRILKPLERPGKIMASGPNYRSHVDPQAAVPDFQSFFVKLPQTLAGPGEPILHPGPRFTEQLDWEVELGIVIGRDVPVTVSEESILDCIFGYTVANDISARDMQRMFRNLTLGKNFLGFCPMGPCIVTRDEIADVTTLRVRTYVNGELMQDASNQDWIFPLSTQLMAIAQGVGFEAGDVVLNGTPGGNAHEHGDRYLRPGDVVRCEIDQIGGIENPVVARD